MLRKIFYFQRSDESHASSLGRKTIIVPPVFQKVLSVISSCPSPENAPPRSSLFQWYPNHPRVDASVSVTDKSTGNIFTCHCYRIKGVTCISTRHRFVLPGSLASLCSSYFAHSAYSSLTRWHFVFCLDLFNLNTTPITHLLMTLSVSCSRRNCED